MGHTGPAVKVCAKQVALSWKCLLWDPPDRTPPPPPTPMAVSSAPGEGSLPQRRSPWSLRVILDSLKQACCPLYSDTDELI